MNWRDPVKVYAEVRPEIFHILEFTQAYNFFRSFMHPFVVYAVAVVTTTTLVVFASLWLM
jgi:hypothetical protein